MQNKFQNNIKRQINNSTSFKSGNQRSVVLHYILTKDVVSP